MDRLYFHFKKIQDFCNELQFKSIYMYTEKREEEESGGFK